ncbi:hypothetical protein HZ326_31596 [Fusarium oxysporum f. sp. albedinis]|nr:hypothetical protein HZ326_31596 [Fusarium oxysporum f. sp. albedinis]
MLSRCFSKNSTKVDKSMGYHLSVALHTAPQDLSASERRDPKGKSSDREHSVTPLECDRAQANRGTPIDHEKPTLILTYFTTTPYTPHPAHFSHQNSAFLISY